MVTCANGARRCARARAGEREREMCLAHGNQTNRLASEPPASQQFRALKAPRVRAYFYKSKLPLVHILSAQQHISIYFVQTTRKFGAQRTTYIFHFLVKKFTNKFRGTFMVVLMVMGWHRVAVPVPASAHAHMNKYPFSHCLGESILYTLLNQAAATTTPTAPAPAPTENMVAWRWRRRWVQMR